MAITVTVVTAVKRRVPLIRIEGEIGQIKCHFHEAAMQLVKSSSAIEAMAAQATRAHIIETTADDSRPIR